MKLFTKDINQKLFAQYRIGSDLNKQKVVAKIFNPYGRGRWYLLNSDPNDADYLWAIVQMGDEVEIGSVSRSELETIRIKPHGLPLERDMYFSDRNAMEVLEGLEKGKTFANGGMIPGRFYKDNTGNELRFIGKDSSDELLFKDGDKLVKKTENDFERDIKETKLFGFFEDGGFVEKTDEELKGMNDDELFEYLDAKAAYMKPNTRPLSSFKAKNFASRATAIQFKNEGTLKLEANFADISKIKEQAEKDYQEGIKRVANKRKKMEHGGEMDEEGVDLFEDYDDIPANVQKILQKYDFEEGDYRTLEKAKKDVEKVGYTFEYSLDGTAYDLRKIGQKGKSEDEDEDNFAEGGKTAAAEHNIKQAKYGARLVGKQKNLDVNKNGKLDAEDFKMLRGEKMAIGGKVKFEDKVKAVKESLLKRKKVSPKVQKDYGKTYSPKEAEESATRITASQRMKYELKKKFKKGGKTIAQTPAPKKDRVFGSLKNKVGSASSKKSASQIELNESIIKTLSEKAKEYNENHSSKVSISTLKAVMRRGMGAFSTSHRPGITRQGWGFARVNKFLLKKGGAKVKAAYVQDDDLL